MSDRGDLRGRTYTPYVYLVGREKIREYARATGETDPVCTNLAAARDAGYRDLVAPPMFAVVYSSPAVFAALLDPDIGLDFARMLHGAQAFVWPAPVVAGDEITTIATLEGIDERGPNEFFVFESRSVNQDRQEVCVGTWTNIVRGP
jgi:acyl dehydratase